MAGVRETGNMFGYHLNRIGSVMTLSRRSLLATLAAAPLVTLSSRPVFAAYPDRPIRLIVPFAPGGNADLVGRLLSESMSPRSARAWWSRTALARAAASAPALSRPRRPTDIRC
jgi:hypothetical protein